MEERDRGREGEGETERTVQRTKAPTNGQGPGYACCHRDKQWMTNNAGTEMPHSGPLLLDSSSYECV